MTEEGSGCIVSYFSLFPSKNDVKKLKTPAIKKITSPQKILNVKKIKTKIRIIITAKIIKISPIYTSNDFTNISFEPQCLHL